MVAANIIIYVRRIRKYKFDLHSYLHFPPGLRQKYLLKIVPLSTWSHLPKYFWMRLTWINILEKNYIQEHPVGRHTEQRDTLLQRKKNNDTIENWEDYSVWCYTKHGRHCGKAMTAIASYINYNDLSEDWLAKGILAWKFMHTNSAICRYMYI